VFVYYAFFLGDFLGVGIMPMFVLVFMFPFIVRVNINNAFFLRYFFDIGIMFVLVFMFPFIVRVNINNAFFFRYFDIRVT